MNKKQYCTHFTNYWIRSAFSAFCLCALLLLLSGCLPGRKKNKEITITLWHTYVEQMRAAMDDLVAEFNATTGAEQGIIVKVTGVANASVINEKLIAAANKDPGAPGLPDMAVAYPDIAVILARTGALMDFGTQFSPEELSRYVPEFLEEGKLGGETLYLLPIAKSTEVLYVNKTFFERFAAETGVDWSCFETFEGILAAGEKYYAWTDAKTPDIPGDGKNFYYPDKLFNYAMIGMEQLGEHLVRDEALDFSGGAFRKIWDSYYTPAVRGSVAIFDNYGNYLAKYGEIVCVTSTSAGAMFYPDTVTYLNNTKEDVEFEILPYPVFKGGEKIAVQRGGGMLIAKSTPEREKAAAVFLKWFTAPKQNTAFAIKAGYLPVTKEAIRDFGKSDTLALIENKNVRKSTLTGIAMQSAYHFYFPPIFSGFDALQGKFSKAMQRAALEAKEKGGPVESAEALERFKREF
ncbi:MAG: extracellular solute-binding protein [Fusobacteriaceae bacterium]|nr:extracellular solute-binding protein [Fusobacteriaceae bacterium]